MLVILATWEAEIRRIIVQGPPEEVVHKTLSQKTQHRSKMEIRVGNHKSLGL
jgi:hypothetical protein